MRMRQPMKSGARQSCSRSVDMEVAEGGTAGGGDRGRDPAGRSETEAEGGSRDDGRETGKRGIEGQRGAAGAEGGTQEDDLQHWLKERVTREEAEEEEQGRLGPGRGRDRIRGAAHFGDSSTEGPWLSGLLRWGGA